MFKNRSHNCKLWPELPPTLSPTSNPKSEKSQTSPQDPQNPTAAKPQHQKTQNLQALVRDLKHPLQTLNPKPPEPCLFQAVAPIGHLVHSVCPKLCEMVPAGHSAQDCAEKEDCLRPGLHKPHSAEPQHLGCLGLGRFKEY